MEPGVARWTRAVLALDLLGRDPGGLGGVHLIARAGPVRDRFLDEARARLGQLQKIHPSVSDDQLFGGIDIERSLHDGTLRMTSGLLARGGPLLLCMAERASPGLAARLAAMLDRGPGAGLIAQDEAAGDEAGLPQALATRLAFTIDLTGLSLAECASAPAPTADGPHAMLSPGGRDQIVRIADAFGIAGTRVLVQAAAAVRAAAACAGRAEAGAEDIETAAILVLAPHATRIPETDAPQEAAPPENRPAEDAASGGESDTPQDRVVEAIRASLPDDLLDRLSARRQRSAQGTGSGAARRSRLRGRPLPSRPGAPDGRGRIDLLATLRACAPWQRIRRAQRPDRCGLIVMRGDIHLRQYRERAGRLLIFVVDASGSAAMARLAEAKGAVELLLARAYARRDQVALIAFRGAGAEVLLPPTRSLVRAKRELASLPGGGGTPLAAGLREAHTMTLQTIARGMTPVIALLSDGQANIALDGAPGRARATEDAETVGRAVALCRAESLLIDAGARPGRHLQRLADTMNGTYLPLPRASSQTIRSAIDAAIQG